MHPLADASISMGPVSVGTASIEAGMFTAIAVAVVAVVYAVVMTMRLRQASFMLIKEFFSSREGINTIVEIIREYLRSEERRIALRAAHREFTESDDFRLALDARVAQTLQNTNTPLKLAIDGLSKQLLENNEKMDGKLTDLLGTITLLREEVSNDRKEVRELEREFWRRVNAFPTEKGQ